jgi:heme/copper-type cytochrome/quinol oxidase subunit 3
LTGAEPRTLVFSVFPFASSGTVYLAERRLAKDDQRGFLIWWLASIALGAIFLIGQITEYARLYAAGINIGTNLFTSAFFTLTGFHGLHVFVGYIQGRRLTEQCFTADGWLRTGDRARRDAAGYVRITGRSKDIIIRGGENVPV